MPETLDKFQELRYNDEKEYRSLQSRVADGRVSNDIRSGKYSLELNVNKQNKHFKEHANYKEGNRYLTISAKKCQEIVSKYSGTGKIERDKSGQFAKKEVVILNREVGYLKDLSGKWTPTNKIKIHYSKSGTHIVPTLRGYKK